MKKYFLSIEDITKSEIFEIFELAKQLKKDPRGDQLNHKIFAVFFEGLLPWSKLSFEAAIKQLEGRTIYFSPNMSNQLFKEKSLEDMIKNLKEQADAVIMGAFSHTTLKRVSKYSDLPVINAVSDLENPCQVLADLFTIKERFNDFNSLKLAYIGNCSSVCNSLILGCAKVGMDVAVACPKNYGPDSSIVELARNYTKVSNSRVTIGIEPKEIIKDANIIYNDIFVNAENIKEKQNQLKDLMPKYQVNDRLLRWASSDFFYMHPLPLHRDEEVTKEVIENPKSIIFDQAENRLHTQKALLIKIMGIRDL